jgi:predicted metal-binding membrane protein
MAIELPRVTARRDPGPVLWAVAGGCWLLLAGLAVLNPGLAHHHGVVADLRSGTAVTAALTTFAGAWLVMVVAMMLPSTVPMVRMFAVVTARVERRTRVRAVFLSAYFAVWLAFAVVALIGDGAVHAVVDTAPWLRERDDLVLAGALALAGVAQFTPLTRRCLRACRDPRGFLFQHYRRGTAAAWALGLRHGLYCLGCCWALMLVMFATATGNLWWMVALTAVMVAEKTTRRGHLLVAPVGVVLLFAAVWLVLAELGSVPVADQMPVPHQHHAGLIAPER